VYIRILPYQWMDRKSTSGCRQESPGHGYRTEYFVFPQKL
jgi:hypothetical protein